MTVFSAHSISAVIPGVEYEVTPGFTTDFPALDPYEYDFEPSGVDGWTLVAGAQLLTSNAQAHTGSKSVALVGNGTPWAAMAERAISGLVVGREYTVTAYSYRAAGSVGTNGTRLSVTGKGSSAYKNAVNAWVSHSYAFTATSTSHTVRLELNSNTANYSYWDDVTVLSPAHSVVTPPVTGEDYPLNVISSTVTIDQGNIPYARVELECALPGEDVLEQLNPFDDLRVEITLEQSFGDWNPGTAHADQNRTFDLTVAARDVDYSEGTLSITAGSDEFLLQMFTRVAETSITVPGLSVKDVVTYALDQINTSLAPGAADGTLDNTDPITVTENLFLNPGGEVNTTNWLSGAAATTLGRSTTVFRSGASSISGTITTGTTATLFLNAAGGIPCAPGESFNGSVWLRLSTGTGSATVTLRSTTSAGATITNYPGSAVAVNSTGWTRVSASATLAGATVANVNAYVSVTGMATGRVLYADDTMLTRGLTLHDAFNGSTAPSGLNYYEWTGDANASTSKHLVQANAITTWEPGESAWDYAAPAVQAAGIRLWADEHRAWHLDGPGVPVAGFQKLGEGENVTEASDSISVLDDSDYFDGVVITYRWIDAATGLEQIKRDVAGVSGKSYTETVERPYPGPGAAQAILDRAAGKGRVFAVEAMSNYSATPGQPVTIALPSSPVQLGVITAVSWELPAARMTVGTRGLTDIPDEAWLLAPLALTWAAATGTWATYTN